MVLNKFGVAIYWVVIAIKSKHQTLQMCFSCDRQGLSPSREKIQLDFIVLCFVTITNSVEYLDNWLHDVWLSWGRQCTSLEFTWKEQKLHTISAMKLASRREFEMLISRI
jgi:hypothetical protein